MAATITVVADRNAGDKVLNMLGIEDPQIVLGYALAIGTAAACVIYGWLKRNEVE